MSRVMSPEHGRLQTAGGSKKTRKARRSLHSLVEVMTENEVTESAMSGADGERSLGVAAPSQIFRGSIAVK